MANQDELLEGFCRGCLVKYDDPTDLLHYTERNRRMFIYSTGIQVKRTDAFTFQICKDCNMNMRLSCKFRKLCRTSDRRFKSYLRLKEIGEATDLATYVKNTDDNFKFPPLSGNSTPANQKIREEDNESTCTSIRNFMSDILQGEEMPDSEARIIKEVIEEEADCLDDSLDSHWLQDDVSMGTDYRLDFSFSPFTTPHAINNDNRYIPNKQIPTKVPYRNNHAKRVFQQLPTMHYDQDDNAVTMKPLDESFGQDNQTDQNNLEEKATDDDLDAKFQNDDTMNDILQSEDYLHHTSNNDVPVKSLDLSAFATEYEISRKITNKINIAVKNVGVSAFEHKSEVQKRDLSMNDMSTKCGDMNTFEAVCGNKRKAISEEKALVSCNDLDLPNKTISKNAANELDIAVNSINSNTFGIESENNSQINENDIEDMSIDSNAFETESETNRRATSELDIAINNMALTTFETTSKITGELIVEDEAVESNGDFNAIKTATEIDGKKTNADKISVASFDLNAFGEESKVDSKLTENELAVKSISTNHFGMEFEDEKKALENEFLEQIIGDCTPKQDPLFEECVDKEKDVDGIQKAVDGIDKNLVVALRDETNKMFSLDDLLVSPARDVIAKVLGPPNGASTPTINNILFGEKLNEDSNEVYKMGHCVVKLEKVDEQVDDLEEFIQEAVKELDVDIKIEPDNPVELPFGIKYLEKGVDIKIEPYDHMDLPLVLKYDLENCECKECKKKYKSLKALKVHLCKVHKIKFPKQKPDYTLKICPHCGYSATDTGNYVRHMNTHKKKTGPFQCAICTIWFESESRLKLHSKVHNIVINETKKVHDKVEKKYVCSTCGAQFKTSSNFAMHKRKHTTAYSQTCDICGKGFHRMVDLQTHRRSHTGERPFSCPQCERKYATKYRLVVHMRTHIAEKPFECDYCSTRFHKKENLIGHIRKSKTCMKKRKDPVKKKSVKRFKCSVCDLKFASQKGLAKHECKRTFIVESKIIPKSERVPVLTEENLKDMPVLIMQQSLPEIIIH